MDIKWLQWHSNCFILRGKSSFYKTIPIDKRLLCITVMYTQNTYTSHLFSFKPIISSEIIMTHITSGSFLCLEIYKDQHLPVFFVGVVERNALRIAIQCLNYKDKKPELSLIYNGIKLTGICYNTSTEIFCDTSLGVKWKIVKLIKERWGGKIVRGLKITHMVQENATEIDINKRGIEGQNSYCALSSLC